MFSDCCVGVCSLYGFGSCMGVFYGLDSAGFEFWWCLLVLCWLGLVGGVLWVCFAVALVVCLLDRFWCLYLRRWVVVVFLWGLFAW